MLAVVIPLVVIIIVAGALAYMKFRKMPQEEQNDGQGRRYTMDEVSSFHLFGALWPPIFAIVSYYRIAYHC